MSKPDKKPPEPPILPNGDSNFPEEMPQSTVEIVECPNMEITHFDAQIAHGLAQEEAEEAMDQTDNKSDSRSSGCGSPTDVGSPESSVGLAEAATVGLEEWDPALDFLDMDMDPRDESPSSTPDIELPGPSGAGKQSIPDRPIAVSEMDSYDSDLPCCSSSFEISTGCVVGCQSCNAATVPLSLSPSPLAPSSLNIAGPMGLELAKEILKNSEEAIGIPNWLAEVLKSYMEANRRSLGEFEGESCGFWTVDEAYSRQDFKDFGPSSCGVTAVFDALDALKFGVRMENVKVNVKLRATQSPISSYLLSRSEAGTTHLDLISAIHHCTCGKIRAKFVQMDKKGWGAEQKTEFIAKCLSSGAVPLLTVNLQRIMEKDPPTLPDAWHHQVLFRISGDYCWLTNPVTPLTSSQLHQLTSGPSVLLIRASDVLAAYKRGNDLGPIVAKCSLDQRWAGLNVIGQIATVVRDRGESVSHIVIPAAYEPGVTVVARDDWTGWEWCEMV